MHTNTLQSSKTSIIARTIVQIIRDDVVRGVFNGKYNPIKLPSNLFLYIGRVLEQTVRSALRISPAQANFEGPDYELFLRLRSNAYVFSGAKTFQETLTLQSLIMDANGMRRNFDDYAEEAYHVYDIFNGDYLKTEMDTAFASAQNAEAWERYTKESQLFPYLKYMTSGDDRVRPNHKEMDGLTFHINDNFWNTNFPPNGFNCRCDVVQLSLEEAKPNLTLNAPPPDKGFEFNPGKGKILFSDAHPYYDVPKQYSGLKSSNFGLTPPNE